MATITPLNAKRVVGKLGGLEVKPVSSEERGLVMGIYGEPGVGKTTLAASIADSDFGRPALYIDARGNPHVVNSYADRIDVVTVEKFAQFEAIRQSLLNEKDLGYKTVIIDTLTEAWAIDLRDLYKPTGDVTWQMHAASTADILQLVRNYVDISTMGPRVNVVFIMQETIEERTINNQKVVRPEIHFNKKLQEYIPSLINFLGRLYIYENTEPYGRILDFTPAQTVQQSKIQRDPNDPAARDIPYQIYKPSLAPLLDTIRGHVAWPTATHSRPRPTPR